MTVPVLKPNEPQLGGLELPGAGWAPCPPVGALGPCSLRGLLLRGAAQVGWAAVCPTPALHPALPYLSCWLRDVSISDIWKVT